MRRLGIFSFYDKDGRVDTYIEYLLKELNTVITELIIVINGKVDDEGKEIFSKYSKKIILRDNVGYDAGAYVDALHQVDAQLGEWDELVLCNDTFYGPFVSMKSIFNRMDRDNVDFWGLNILRRGLLNHIQSYFLVFRRNVLHSGDLLNYLYKNIDSYERDISNIFGTFETGLFTYLVKKNYQYSAYTDTELFDIYQSAHICIEKYGLPILKKKSFAHDKFDLETQIYTLQYIYNNTEYDVRHILRNAQRQYAFSLKLDEILEHRCDVTKKLCRVPKAKYSEEELLKLIGGKDFYIYGAGVIARELALLYFLEEKEFRGFVVSDNQSIEKPCLFGFPVKYYHEIPQDVMLIVGVSGALTENIKERIDLSHQIICLWE